jgi:hypothetical protein
MHRDCEDDILYNIKIGSVLYLKENLDNKVYLFDILQTNYPKYMYLYYMVDDERPYKRTDFLTQSERRKIIIEKILK